MASIWSLYGLCRPPLGVALIRSSGGVVSSGLQHSPPAAGSSAPEAVQAKAPKPAIKTNVKSPVVILRTVPFPYPKLIALLVNSENFPLGHKANRGDSHSAWSRVPVAEVGRCGILACVWVNP